MVLRFSVLTPARRSNPPIASGRCLIYIRRYVYNDTYTYIQKEIRSEDDGPGNGGGGGEGSGLYSDLYRIYLRVCLYRRWWIIQRGEISRYTLRYLKRLLYYTLNSRDRNQSDVMPRVQRIFFSTRRRVDTATYGPTFARDSRIFTKIPKSAGRIPTSRRNTSLYSTR